MVCKRIRVNTQHAAGGLELENDFSTALPDCPHTQRIRFANQHEIEGGFVYNMCSNYAAHGDLSDLIHQYSDSSTQIPEPFIWHVFAASVDAIHTMNTGHCASKDSSRPRKTN
jgi:hypothetical protein